jgi:mannosyltransferase
VDGTLVEATADRAPDSRVERAWRLMPLVVALFGLALGLVRLGAQPLSFDELVTRATATRSWDGLWAAARDTEAPHLVYYGLLKPWLAVAGTSDWPLRLPSVVAAALAAGATALLGRALFGRVAGLVAGVALAAGSFFVSWAQQARGYTLAVLLATLAAYAFVRAVQDRRTAWWIAWAAALAAAAWVNVFAFSVLGAQLVAFFLVRPRPPLRVPALVLGGAVIAVAPQLALVASGDNGQLDWIPTPTPYHVAVGMWDWASRNPVLLIAAAIGLVQLVRGVVPGAARWKTALVAIWLVAPLVATLLASIAQPAFEARYVLVATPALALAVGAAVASLPPRAAIALAVVLALSMAVRLGQHYVSPGKALIRSSDVPRYAGALPRNAMWGPPPGTAPTSHAVGLGKFLTRDRSASTR